MACKYILNDNSVIRLVYASPLSIIASMPCLRIKGVDFAHTVMCKEYKETVSLHLFFYSRITWKLYCDCYC